MSSVRSSYIVFFDLATRLAATPREYLWAHSFPFASKFMLRRSEVTRLQRTHVHIHDEPIDFVQQPMITVELQDNKSFAYRTQSVSYVLSESTGQYSPAALSDKIALSHTQGADSQWFFSLTSDFPERPYFAFFDQCIKTFKLENPAYASKRLVFHSLRASEIVELFNAGVHIDIIRRKARHARWSTTFDSYAAKAVALSRPPSL